MLKFETLYCLYESTFCTSSLMIHLSQHIIHLYTLSKCLVESATKLAFSHHKWPLVKFTFSITKVIVIALLIQCGYGNKMKTQFRNMLHNLQSQATTDITLDAKITNSHNLRITSVAHLHKTKVSNHLNKELLVRSTMDGSRTTHSISSPTCKHSSFPQERTITYLPEQVAIIFLS